MKIPLFKNTHDAVKFVQKHFGNKEVLRQLLKKRDQMSKKADKLLKSGGKNIKELDNMSKIIVSAHAYVEAVEMMEKTPHWKEVWGKLKK